MDVKGNELELSSAAIAYASHSREQWGKFEKWYMTNYHQLHTHTAEEIEDGRQKAIDLAVRMHMNTHAEME